MTGLVVPVFVADLICCGETASGEGYNDLGSGSVKLVKDPELGERFFAGFCGVALRLEGSVESAEDISGCLVDFITELTVGVHFFMSNFRLAPRYL